MNEPDSHSEQEVSDKKKVKCECFCHGSNEYEKSGLSFMDSKFVKAELDLTFHMLNYEIEGVLVTRFVDELYEVIKGRI